MANESKRWVVTISPKNAPRARFFHREYDKKSDALKRLRKIKNTPINKREILNPRVSKNRFYKGKRGYK